MGAAKAESFAFSENQLVYSLIFRCLNFSAVEFTCKKHVSEVGLATFRVLKVANFAPRKESCNTFRGDFCKNNHFIEDNNMVVSDVFFRDICRWIFSFCILF